MIITKIGNSSAQILSLKESEFLFSFGDPVTGLIEGTLYTRKTATYQQRKHIRDYVANNLSPYSRSSTIPQVNVCDAWFEVALRALMYDEPVPVSV